MTNSSNKAGAEAPIPRGSTSRQVSDVFDLANCDDVGSIADLISQGDTAREFGISPNTLKSWLKIKGFPQPVRIGNYRFYSRRLIQKYFLERMAEATEAQKGA